MNDLIRLSKCFLDREEQRAVINVLDSGYLGMGNEVKDFENELARYLGCSEVVCVSSGTAALHLSLQAIGAKAGDEILVPTITYVACFQAISATGAKPVACDIDINDGSICIKDASRKVNERTKALMYVHYASLFNKRSAVIDFVNNHNIRLIEDAAHSFGCYYPNKKLVGDDSDVVCFSFDGIKNITCGEGGAVISTNKNTLELIKDARLLGVKKDYEARFNKDRTWDLCVDQQGWRYHMSDINAAIGRAQLKKINIFRELRNKISNFYISNLCESECVFIHENYNSNILPHIFPVLFKSKTIRDGLKDFLKSNNIETGVHYKPNHLLKKYATDDCKNSEIFYECVLSLPIHCSIKEEEMQKITRCINTFIGSSF